MKNITLEKTEKDKHHVDVSKVIKSPELYKDNKKAYDDIIDASLQELDDELENLKNRMHPFFYKQVYKEHIKNFYRKNKVDISNLEESMKKEKEKEKNIEPEVGGSG